MGKMINGLSGSCNGKIGNLVVYELMGKTVIRTIGKSSKPPTEKQLEVRQRMRVMSGFLYPLHDVINKGFCESAVLAQKYPHNMAVSYNIRNAMTGVYPNIGIDYTKVMLAQGTILPAQQPAVERVGQELRFTWAASPLMPWLESTDRVMLEAYFPDKNYAVSLIGGAVRIKGAETLRLPHTMQDEYLVAYIAFLSDNGKQASDSVYIRM